MQNQPFKLDCTLDVSKTDTTSLERKKRKMTNRNVVYVSGIPIDEHDYDIVKQISPREFLIENKWGDNWGGDNALIGTGGRENGHRVEKFLFRHDESMIDLIPELDGLKELALYVAHSFPDEFERLIHLESLFLHFHSKGMVSFPVGICNMKNLKNLSSHHFAYGRSTNFQSLPDEIGRLTSLESLSLSYKHVRLLPSSVGELMNLKVIEICFTRENEHEHLPNELGRLKNLESIYLWNLPNARIPLSQMYPVLINLKRLRRLHIPVTLYREEGTYQILSNIAQQCPSLGCIGWMFQYKKGDQYCEALLNTLICNRIKSSQIFALSPAISPSVWPLILENPLQKYFSGYKNGHYNDMTLWGSLGKLHFKQFISFASRGIYIYTLSRGNMNQKLYDYASSTPTTATTSIIFLLLTKFQGIRQILLERE